MKNLIIAIITFVSVNTFAQKGKALPDNFYTCWAASYEEDDQKANVKVFRHCDYREFKPSFYRQRYVFNKNGTCQVLLVGETDNHYYLDCKWTYDKKKGIVNVADPDKKFTSKFQVKSVDDTFLKISPVK